MTCLESPVVFSSASSLSPPPAGSGPAALQDEQQGKQADDGQEKEREEGESGELADVLQELAATRAERDGLLQLATVQVRHCLSRPSTQPFFFKAPPFACVSTAFLPSETAAPSLAAVQNQQLLQLAARAATPTGGGTGSRGDEVLPALQVPSFGVLSLPFHCLSLCFRCAFTAPINVLSPPFHRFSPPVHCLSLCFHCPFTAALLALQTNGVAAAEPAAAAASVERGRAAGAIPASSVPGASPGTPGINTYRAWAFLCEPVC